MSSEDIEHVKKKVPEEAAERVEKEAEEREEGAADTEEKEGLHPRRAPPSRLPAQPRPAPTPPHSLLAVGVSAHGRIIIPLPPPETFSPSLHPPCQVQVMLWITCYSNYFPKQ